MAFCKLCEKDVPYIKTIYPVYGDEFKQMEGCNSCLFSTTDNPEQRRVKAMHCAGGDTINQSPGYFKEVSRRKHVDTRG